MRYVEAGGLRLSVIGLGTWQFGSREWGYGEAYANEVAPAIVRRAIELGITLIDTAEVYGFGRSERILGEAIRGRRDGLVIASKLVPALPLPVVVRWQVRVACAVSGWTPSICTRSISRTTSRPPGRRWNPSGQFSKRAWCAMSA